MFALPLLAMPLLWVLVDRIGGIRASLVRTAPMDVSPVEDFQVLVPIYGSVDYLENVEYLRQYGDQVVLVTTDSESEQFYADLSAVAEREHFQIFRAEVPAHSTRRPGVRATSGTIRDRIIRQALQEVVTAAYVVCIDADTTTKRSFGELVGHMVAGGFDFVSVPLVPANTARFLGRLQELEYRTAMKLRRIAAWQVSGACHAGRSVVHREIMAHHSLFFQGNDVEAGLLAQLLGYRVGHIQFEVPTTVPETARGWFRQRLAWAGGEFRLFVMNAHLTWRHPFFWLYGSVIAVLALPVRWASLMWGGWALASVLVMHTALSIVLHWRRRSWWLLVFPFYTAFSNLVMTPLGVIWYLKMAITDRNPGIIGIRR